MSDNQDRLAGAIMQCPGISVTTDINRHFSPFHASMMATIPAVTALADFQEALQQPIQASVRVELPTVLNVNRSLDMVSHLDIKQNWWHDDGSRISHESDFLHIVNSFPNLVDLELKICTSDDRITDSGMQALFVGCPHLKTASFGNVPRVTNRTLEYILEHRLPLHKLLFHQAAIRQRDVQQFRNWYFELQILPVPIVTVCSCSLWWWQ